MIWSAQQELALKEISKWVKDTHSKSQIFRLFGYAGTGKTTLINEIAQDVCGDVLHMAFTGKAALVMRKKGCIGASTIHSSIYRPLENKKTGKIEFLLNRDSPVGNAELIIVDEASMVNEEIGRDLMHFGVKILVLGDPFQLPPVKGEGFFTEAKPDVMLTEIHRQAIDNPIIRMSIDIREGRKLSTKSDYGDCKVFDRALMSDPRMNKKLVEVDQILCGMNNTRRALNAKVRLLKGIANPNDIFEPMVGDRLVCIKNNRKKGLLNGGMWTLEAVDGNSLEYNIKVSSLDGSLDTEVDAKVLRQMFDGREADVDWKVRKYYDEFTFGNVLTVHKSQGSQWDTVLVVDESAVFRENAARHLYTAVTRAAEKVYVAV